MPDGTTYQPTPTWWEGYWGKFIRDAYSAIIPAVLLVLWDWVMSVKVPPGKEGAVLALGFVIVRTFDRRVRAWIAKQKTEMI